MIFELLGKKDQSGPPQEASATVGKERGLSALPTPRENPSSTSEGAVSDDVAPRRSQPGESGEDRDYGLPDQSIRTRGISQQFMGVPKTVPPIVTDQGGFSGISRTSGGVCKVLPFSQSVHIESELRQGVSEAMYEMQLGADGFLSKVSKIKTDISRLR